jgi:hypothetical protein
VAGAVKLVKAKAADVLIERKKADHEWPAWSVQ